MSDWEFGIALDVDAGDHQWLLMGLEYACGIDGDMIHQDLGNFCVSC